MTYQERRKNILNSILYYRAQVRKDQRDPNSHISPFNKKSSLQFNSEQLTKNQERLAALRRRGA